MKIAVTCSQCIDEFQTQLRETSGELLAGDYIQQYYLPLSNNALYEFDCNRGHSSKVIITNSKHELLFEAGLHAIADGYNREALLAFASSLEAFYRLAIYALLLPTVDKQPAQQCTELLYKAWKSIAKQVERQIGAFQLLYYTTIQETAPLFNASYFGGHRAKMGKSGENDPYKIRNEATHAGFIPTRDQALIYAEAVHLYIKEIYVKMKQWNWTKLGRAEMVLRIESGEDLLKPKQPDYPYMLHTVPCFLRESCFQYNQPDAIPMSVFTAHPLDAKR